MTVTNSCSTDSLAGCTNKCNPTVAALTGMNTLNCANTAGFLKWSDVILVA